MKRNHFLIVVDMQNDFIDGSLGTSQAQAMLPEAAETIRRRREDGYRLIATLDTHSEDYLDTPEGKKLPVRHCIRASHGWELNPMIREALGDCTLVEKPTFGSVTLPGILEGMAESGEPLTLELMGLCTDICVISNALLLKAHFPDARLSVHTRCCAGVTPEKHLAALDVMQSCQIDLI